MTRTTTTTIATPAAIHAAGLGFRQAPDSPDAAPRPDDNLVRIHSGNVLAEAIAPGQANDRAPSRLQQAAARIGHALGVVRHAVQDHPRASMTAAGFLAVGVPPTAVVVHLTEGLADPEIRGMVVGTAWAFTSVGGGLLGLRLSDVFCRQPVARASHVDRSS